MFTEHPAGCGITEQVKQWMESIQMSGVDEESTGAGMRSSDYRAKNVATPLKMKRKKTEPTIVNFEKETPYDKYSKEMNLDDVDRGLLSRNKRAIPNRLKEKERNTCSLFIQTDPLIWRHISEQVCRLTCRRFVE